MEYLTQNEVMERLNISRTTLYRMVEEGCPHKVMGRKKLFELGAVEAFMQSRKDDTVKQLEVGREYTNNDIVEIFKVGMMGGMRRSHSKNALVLISFHDGNERIYNDYWKDDILYYTGQGLSGTQELTGQNRTLAESNTNGITVYLFEMFYSQRYQYRGIVKLAGEPFTEEECDMDGVMRTVWKFPLKIVNSDGYMDSIVFDEQESHLHKQVVDNLGGALSIFAAASKMVLSGSERTVTTKRAQYNPVIREYVRMRADGHCELCGQKAPFEIDGKPYLQFEHIVPVTLGGKDTISNIAAVCPNCNARLAMLKSEEDKKRLIDNIQRNEEKFRDKLNGTGGN